MVLGISLVPYVIIGLIVVICGSRQNHKKDYSYHPKVTVFIPTWNEEEHIAKKLDNLLEQMYPIAEILIFDCSSDGTKRIVEEYQKKHSNIQLIRQKQRSGMAITLNDALKKAKGEVIVKTDCDSLTKSKDALKELIANFSQEGIGGVSGICVNKGLEGSFRSFMTRLQISESNLDSTTVAHSTSLLAFRKSAVSEVDSNSVAEDTEEFVLIRKKGYRTIIDSSVISEEDVPKTFAKRRLQKDRRAQGIITVLFQNISILFNPRYGLYGLVVFPINFFLLVVSPFVILLSLILLGYQLFLINPIYLMLYILLVVSTLIFYKIQHPRLSWLLALIDLQLSGLLGTLQFLRGGYGAKWKRVR